MIKNINPIMIESEKEDLILKKRKKQGKKESSQRVIE